MCKFHQFLKYYFLSSKRANAPNSFTTTLREMRPYLELFWSLLSHFLTEYGEMWSISPYLVQMWENTDQSNPEYGHILRSANITRFLKEKRENRMITRDMMSKIRTT